MRRSNFIVPDTLIYVYHWRIESLYRVNFVCIVCKFLSKCCLCNWDIYQSLQKYIEAKTKNNIKADHWKDNLQIISLMSVFFFSLQQITDLKKENFNLKLRIYFMEERMQQRLGDGDDVFKIVRCTSKFLSNKF